MIANQVVQFRLAELQTEVELLRSLLYRAITVYLSGRDATYFASMCKLKAGRLAREVSDTCLQYYGECADVYNTHSWLDKAALGT